MLFELSLGLVMISANGGFLDGAVHPLDLSVGPRMIGFGQSVVDVVAGTGVFKGMSPKDLASGYGLLDVRRCRTAVAWEVKWVPLSVRIVWIL